MDAICNCFGKHTSPSPLRENENDDDYYAEDEANPLLPKHPRPKGAAPPSGMQDPSTNGGNRRKDKGALDKLVDGLAALSVGKLPSQDQVTRILQALLVSDLLRLEDHDNEDHSVPKAAFHGTGPTSRRGRKVLEDVRGVVQAALQFGMEKNDDDKLQDLIYHLSLMDENPITIPKVDLSASSSSAAESSKDAMRAGGNVAQDLKDEIPTSKELSNDAQIFVHAFRTLVQTFLTSPVFRFFLIDALSILRDLVVHGAADISRAASQVQHAAQDIEESARTTDVAAKVQGGYVVKGLGKEIAGRVSETARDVKETTTGKAAEWVDVGREAVDTGKKDLVERMQQVLVQALEDPASRNAIRALLILVRKYGDKLAETSDAIAEGAEKLMDTAEQAAANTYANAFPSLHPKEKTALGYGWNSYPPPTTLYPPVSPIEGKGPFEAALCDLKSLLERIGQGYSLDPLLAKFGKVVKDLNSLPRKVSEDGMDDLARGDGTGNEADNDDDEGHMPASMSTETLKPAPRKKKRTRSKRNKARKGHHVEELGRTPRRPSMTASEEGHSEGSVHDEPNVIRAYFMKLGEYLDRALEEPRWVTSRMGQGELDHLSKEGVELLDVLGEVATDVEDGAFGVHFNKSNGEGGTSNRATEDGEQDKNLELRQQFKTHVKEFWYELEKYIAAVEKDRSTMKLLRAFDALETSTSDLFFTSAASIRNRPALSKHIWSSLRWTDWLGWALPKIIRMVPFNVIPIPTVEAKSESGGWEVGLYALFVRGNAREAQVKRGLVGRDEVGGEVKGGIETTLVPDRIVMKEWTEVAIDMAQEYREHGKQPQGQSGSGSMRPPPEPRVETTSRVRMHVDGIRAKIQGLGYYFKSGWWFGYEDEGILGVDIGMRHTHGGLGFDVEIEMTTADDSVPPTDLKNLPLEPLFRVVDVNVRTQGVHVQLEKSRHWFLNKVLVQRLAGQTVSKAVKYRVQDLMREELESLAIGIARLMRDVEVRREERKRRRVEERKEYAAKMGRFDVDHLRGVDDEEESFGTLVGDWLYALVRSGPKLFQGRVRGDESAKADIDITGKGVVYHQTTGSEETAQGKQKHPEDLTLAVGGGAQLFGDKQVPYGARKEADPVPEEGEGLVGAAKRTVDSVTSQAMGTAVHAATRGRQRVHDETEGGWRSAAFDV